MWCARISAASNLSLLHFREVVERAVRSRKPVKCPSMPPRASFVESWGGVSSCGASYWHRMPFTRSANDLGAIRPLPNFYWKPEQTAMRCIGEPVESVRRHGFARHIQRLMTLGNFAVLAGISRIAVSHRFCAGFVDAYERVKLPNVRGMDLFADDTFTTKPCAASASYIDEMSDNCGSCPYDWKARTMRTPARSTISSGACWRRTANASRRTHASRRFVEAGSVGTRSTDRKFSTPPRHS